MATSSFSRQCVSDGGGGGSRLEIDVESSTLSQYIEEYKSAENGKLALLGWDQYNRLIDTELMILFLACAFYFTS